MKIKELKCNMESEIFMLTESYNGNDYNIIESEPEIKTDCEYIFYLIEGIGDIIENNNSVKYFTKDMISL
jgi:hypothetical protein